MVYKQTRVTQYIYQYYSLNSYGHHVGHASNNARAQRTQGSNLHHKPSRHCYQTMSVWKSLQFLFSPISILKPWQRSESTNKVLNRVANETTNLSKFTIAYQDLVRGMRSTELQDNFQCKRGALIITVRTSGILSYAAKVLNILVMIEFMMRPTMAWEEKY